MRRPEVRAGGACRKRLLRGRILRDLPTKPFCLGHLPMARHSFPPQALDGTARFWSPSSLLGTRQRSTPTAVGRGEDPTGTLGGGEPSGTASGRARLSPYLAELGGTGPSNRTRRLLRPRPRRAQLRSGLQPRRRRAGQAAAAWASRHRGCGPSARDAPLHAHAPRHALQGERATPGRGELTGVLR